MYTPNIQICDFDGNDKTSESAVVVIVVVGFVSLKPEAPHPAPNPFPLRTTRSSACPPAFARILLAYAAYRFLWLAGGFAEDPSVRIGFPVVVGVQISIVLACNALARPRIYRIAYTETYGGLCGLSRAILCSQFAFLVAATVSPMVVAEKPIECNFSVHAALCAR